MIAKVTASWDASVPAGRVIVIVKSVTADAVALESA
jgi:hypothetical protein